MWVLIGSLPSYTLSSVGPGLPVEKLKHWEVEQLASGNQLLCMGLTSCKAAPSFQDWVLWLGFQVPCSTVDLAWVLLMHPLLQAAGGWKLLWTDN